jgi:glycosyltransferase involved in cell wall biosynthesis
VNRSVLIVTPFFAPQNHSAVFRAYKLAKYLPQFGWTPVVLTADKHYEYTEDETLLSELPPEVEIIACRYIEPSLRGVRMALGGKDRTFKAMKRGAKHGSNGSSNGSEFRSGSAKGISSAQATYQSLLKNWIQVPDAHWPWARTAAAAGNRILQERNIDLVLTTAPPYSSLMVGQALHSTGAKWVADLRDPLAYTQRLSSDTAGVYQRQRNIVKDTLSNADAVTVAASCFRSIYFDMFGKRGPDPVFIPTGVDEGLAEFAGCSESHNPYLIFPGEYLHDYDSTFLETFASALDNPKVKQMGVKLMIIGTLEINLARVAPLVERLGIHEHVEFHDQLPQGEVYNLLQRAIAGVLIPGPRAYWWTTFAKMTDYIGLRKPVVAIVPDPSEARSALTRSGLGVFLDGELPARTETLTRFLLGKHKSEEPSHDECERYTVRRQVQSFVEVFESVLA